MISKTCGYAIRGIVYLALEENRKRKIGIHEIANELAIPLHFMGKVMQELSKRAIINSIKGPNGGFYVNERTISTNLIEIIEAIDGLGVLRKCYLGREECSSVNPCPMHDEFDACRLAIFKTFEEQTIANLVSKVKKEGKMLGNFYSTAAV